MMTTTELVCRYIASAERVFKEIQLVGAPLNVGAEDTRKVMKQARAYLDDAKYYRDIGMFDVSLTSVAYSEGLLDALKLLGTVKFEWSIKPEEGEK